MFSNRRSTANPRNAANRTRRGTSLIEVLCGTMFLVPIMLFSVDLGTLLLANQINDHLAKDAARAAANQSAGDKAKAAASKTLNNFSKSVIVTALSLDDFKYDEKGGTVVVTTKMNVSVPAPFPGFAGKQFVARSVEPIVATPAAI